MFRIMFLHSIAEKLFHADLKEKNNGIKFFQNPIVEILSSIVAINTTAK